jgi:hypothetical protein
VDAGALSDSALVDNVGVGRRLDNPMLEELAAAVVWITGVGGRVNASGGTVASNGRWVSFAGRQLTLNKTTRIRYNIALFIQVKVSQVISGWQ